MPPGEPDQVSAFEGGGFLVASVVVLLILGLGALELCFRLIVDLVVLLCKGFSGWVWVCPGTGGGYPEGTARVATIVGEERGHAGGGVPGIVVCELSQGQDVVPVSLLMVAEDP